MTTHTKSLLLDEFQRYATLLALVLCLTCSGCRDPKSLLIQRAQTAMTGGWPAGRNAATTLLVGDWRSGDISLDLAIDHAHLLLDQKVPGSTIYAGAVLDLAEQLSDELPKDPAVSFILLQRIGRLAFRSAEAAAGAGRYQEAESLMLAGPVVWQQEPYWRRYDDHDALVAMIMAARGNRDAGIRRLIGRPMLGEVSSEALSLLRQQAREP